MNAKYETDITVSFFTDNATFRLAPEWVFGLDEGDFTGTPTRWTSPGITHEIVFLTFARAWQDPVDRMDRRRPAELTDR